MHRIHVFVSVLLLCLTIGAANAQGIPQSITYQGKLTDASGNPVPDSTYSMQFKIFSEQFGGTQLWDSGQVNVATAGGQFTVVLQPLNSATFTTEAAWLEMKVGADPPMPRVQMNSAPFALRAGGLSLPFSGSTNNLNVAFFIISTGLGDAIRGLAAGSGRAGYFEINNTSNTVPALYAVTNGSGPAIRASALGSGLAGEFLGTVQMTGFKLATGAAAGKVLTSDASGVGTWQTASGGTYSAGAGLTLAGSVFSISNLGVATSMIADGAVNSAKITDGSVLGADIASAQVVRSLNGLRDNITLAAGTNITITPSGNTLTIASTGDSGGGWSLTGNSGTDPGTNFLGTSDNRPLLLKVWGSRALQLQCSTGDSLKSSVNVIGGYEANVVTAGVYGATIAGGGGGYRTSPFDLFTHIPNKITDDYCTVGGGWNNRAGNDSGTTSDAGYATVGGGTYNIASGAGSTIPGGSANAATGMFAFAAGSRAKSFHQGTFVWSDSQSADFTSTGNNQFLIRAAGGVGIGTASPSHSLTVQSANASTLRLIGPGAVYGFQGTLNFGDGNHAYIQEDEDDRLTIYSRLRTSITGGYVGIGTASPGEKLQVDSGNLLVRGPSNFSSGTEAKLMLGDGSNYLRAVHGQGLRFGVYGGVDALSVDNGGDVKVKGNLKVLSRSTSATVVELGEGLDYAEGFDVSNPSEAGPGTVMVIDPANPGKLAVCAKAYDRRVAGIVAGAKNLGSGVRLGSGRYDHDVALAGRVYCNVDATAEAIEPGDLLTTASRSGCAMKVTDYARAQGAILGKAMEPLEKGQTGQILVLVTLQ